MFVKVFSHPCYFRHSILVGFCRLSSVAMLRAVTALATSPRDVRFCVPRLQEKLLVVLSNASFARASSTSACFPQRGSMYSHGS